MESFKTLINALRALLGGLDAKIAEVKGGLARVWDWVDGLAWVARSTTIERLPETTVHFEGTWNGDQQITASLGATINTTGFTPGQQYTVYYDGKPYSMYYYVADGDKAFVYDLDNLAYGGDFMLAGSAGEWAVRITGGVSGEACDESHTFYIPAETKAEEKLPDVFLDMDWIPKAQAVDLLTGYVLAEHEDIVYSESEMVRLNRELFEIIEGEKYTVIWGGGTYSCTGLSIAVDSLTIPFIGNASIQDLGDDTGEPFLICKYPDEYASMGMVMAIFAADKETLTALASSPLTVRQTRLELPEDMLPSSVKAEIAGKLDAKNPSGEGYFEMNPFTDLDTGKRVTPGEGSFNVGWRGSAEGRWATNIGSGSAAGGYSVCIGSGEAKAYESTAIGGGITEVNDENDSVSEKNGHHSIAIGVGATAARPYQVVVGKYNVINDFNSKDEYIYILGKGSFIDERSNAHTIDNKGNGWFSGEVYVGSTGGVNRDEGSVKLLKDGGDGNGTSLTATHTAATSRAALTSGEKLGVALGKIAKWLADLGSLAFKSTVGKSDLDTELTEIIENSDVTTKMDKENPTGTGSFSLNRKADTTVGNYSVAEGQNTTASGTASHAEGSGAVASGNRSHAEGQSTTASGAASHAEGTGTTASGAYGSHAEGRGTTASGLASHAEGNNTKASGGAQHVQGTYNVEDTAGTYAHIVGGGSSDDDRKNIHTLDWSGNAWFSGDVFIGGTSADDESAVKLSEVKTTADSAATAASKAQSTADKKLDKTNPTGTGAFSLNRKADTTVGAHSFVCGSSCEASGETSHAEGMLTTASGADSHAEGWLTIASGSSSHTEGVQTTASGTDSHAEGSKTTASGVMSHAEGADTIASGDYSHAEGSDTEASGNYSHAEGYETVASGDWTSHAEGWGTTASESNSHAEGYKTIASGVAAHAEGDETTASGGASHAEGDNTIASGFRSHAEGWGTTANGRHQHVQGTYNVEDTAGTYAHIVGGGSSDDDRKNIHTLDWDGNGWFAGKVYVGGTSQDDAAALDETVVKYSGGSFYTADGTAIDVDLGGGGEGGGSDVVVDEALNSNSTNPVQNKAINAAITEIRTTANNAANTASSAASTASTASTKADAAQTAAGSAATAASKAQTTADAKLDKENPTGTGSFSLNRKADTTVGNYSVAEGYGTTASGNYSHAEGYNTAASEGCSHAEGYATTASGAESHAEGADTIASGNYSHAEGDNTEASEQCSHAEGYGTTASGKYSHAEGWGTTASGSEAHAEGYETAANGQFSHAEGYLTIAAGISQHVQGQCNIEDKANMYAHIVGGGNSYEDGVVRKNIHTLDWDGNGWFNGTVECAGIIMTSPDGTRYKVTVANGGTLQVTVKA